MMHWHFGADAAKATWEYSTGDLKEKTEKKGRGERRKRIREGGGLLRMLGRGLGDSPRLSLSLM